MSDVYAVDIYISYISPELVNVGDCIRIRKGAWPL